MENFTYKIVEKEMISNLSFHKELELDQDDDIKQRLERATLLGNIHHSKVTIYFHDDEGPKKVETKFICLKGGVWIPISRITDVEYNS
jgi:hypothetical protein